MNPENDEMILWSGRSVMLTLVVALLLMAAWLALTTSSGNSLGFSSSAAAQAAEPDVPGTMAMTITVEAKTMPAEPGDLVTYTIKLAHIGGTSPVIARLSNTVPSGLLLAPKRVSIEEVAGDVNPLEVHVKNGILDWLGSLEANSGLRISYPAKVDECYTSGLVDITNTVWGKRLGGPETTRSVDLSVDCFDAVDPDNVKVSLSFKGTDEELQTFVPGTKAFLHIEATNDDSNPAVLGLQGIFPSTNFNIGMPPSVRRLPHLGWNPDGGSAVLAADDETRTRFIQLLLKSNTTQKINLPIWLTEVPEPDTEYTVKLGYCITEDGKTCPGADPKSTEPPPSFQWLEPATLTIRYRDLGDAPDSTNHAASPMSAYPTVQAHFPTVFDPASGLPQGPAHHDPRPYHLGRRVSPEAEADIGPDLDPSNNIRPAANVPNRDRRDDGLRLFSLAFQDCSTSTFPVRVLIRPAAVAYFDQHGGKGYLNVWMDGNRDGDWADSGQCGQGPALEHIVIDQVVDVATLGAGLHTINVTTGLVPWPLEQAPKATWLRLTLSEKPSNKTLNTGGISHGDGRGFAAPFDLGETEDYLYRPPNAPGGGVDIQVQARAKLRPVATPGGGMQAGVLAPDISLNFEKIEVSVRARNVGSKKAEKYRIRVPLPWVDPSTIEFDPFPGPGIQGFLDGNTVIFDVPGAIDTETTLAGTNW